MSDDPASATDGNQDPAPSSSADTAAPSPPNTADNTATATPSPPSGDTPDSHSPPSGDSRQSDREGLLAAVRAVVPPSTDSPKVPSSDVDPADGQAPVPDQAAASGGQAPPAPDAPLDLTAPDPTDAELKKLRPETRRRFERLLAQRNEARTSLEQIQPELTQHRQLQGYLSQHQLAPDDVNSLLAVGAALRAGDYKGFLEGVTPYVMAAQEAMGLRVARDLQTQVDDGTLSEEAAREMTRTRHRAMAAEQRLQEQTTIATTEATNRNVMAIRHGVEQWETNIRTRDPDYPHKANAVRRFSQALLQERGVPQTQEQAVALVQAAYDEANAELRRLRPVPQPTRPAPSGIHSAANGATPPTAEPQTMMDAARRALAAMRQAP